MTGVSLLDLQPRQCRRVVAEAPYVFCGRPVAHGTSWCDACAREVFTKEGYERLVAGRKAPRHVRAEP